MGHELRESLAAVGNNGVGIAGVIWAVQLMALRFESENYMWTDDSAVNAIDYAVLMVRRFPATVGVRTSTPAARIRSSTMPSHGPGRLGICS